MNRIGIIHDERINYIVVEFNTTIASLDLHI